VRSDDDRKVLVDAAVACTGTGDHQLQGHLPKLMASTVSSHQPLHRHRSTSAHQNHQLQLLLALSKQEALLYLHPAWLRPVMGLSLQAKSTRSLASTAQLGPLCAWHLLGSFLPTPCLQHSRLTTTRELHLLFRYLHGLYAYLLSPHGTSCLLQKQKPVVSCMHESMPRSI
jgi:hypothetical protein